MLKRILLIIFIVTMAVIAIACTPVKTPVPAPPVQDADALMKEQIIKDATELVKLDEEPEKMIALIESGIQNAGQDGAEIMVSGLETLQESHLADYTDLLLTEENQKALMGMEKDDLNNQETYSSIENKELADLLGKLRKSGYRFDNFEGSWYPIVDYSSYKRYSEFLSQEMKDYIELMAVESDKVSMKDAAIVIDLKDLSNRLILAENYIVKYGASSRVDRVKESYAGYLWNLIGGSNNTPIYDFETKEIKPEVREAYETFSRENPDLVSTKAVRNWIEVLRDGKFVFDEGTMYQALDNIYGEALKDLGIEADYK